MDIKIEYMKEDPNKIPVSIFLCCLIYCVKNCTIPSIIMGNSTNINIWYFAYIIDNNKAISSPIIISVHLAHTGNGNPFMKKFLSGI